MSHSKKNTNEDVNVKTGRRIQNIISSKTAQSPIRRSSRVKSLIKQNKSPPETSVEDVGNISSTHTTKNTRRQIDFADNSTMTEKNKTLRSRRNSVMSDTIDMSDTETAIVTSGKRNRNIFDNEELNKTDFQTSKRFTRAGSETMLSPVTTRPTYRTRANSVDSEATITNLIETNNSGSVNAPVHSRKRNLILSLKTPMLEETRTPVVTLDYILPSVKEINETNLKNPTVDQTNKSESISKDLFHSSSKNASKEATETDLSDLENPTIDQTNKSESGSKDPFNCNSENASKEATETDLSAKEVHNSSVESSPAHQDTEISMPIVDKTTVPNTDDTKEDAPTDTITSPVPLVTGILKESCQIFTENTIRESGLAIKNSVNNSVKEEDGHLSDKENQPVNIINSAQTKDDTVPNAILRSPKQITMSSLSTNKSLKDNDNEADSPNSMQKLVITSEESLGETLLNDSADQNASGIEMCDGSSLDDNIQIVKCPDNLSDSDNDKVHSVENETTEPTQEVSSDSETVREGKNVDTILSSEAEIQQTSKEYVTEKCKESSDVHMESEDFESINKEEDEANNVIKNIQSSTATDFSVGSTEILEEDVTQDTSMLDNSSASEEKCMINPKSCKEKINESGIQETYKKGGEKMKDDNSGSNIDTNLSEDILADKWKVNNSDKNSMHTVSVEKLEDESENEYDIVLVDKEAWQATEDMSKEEETKKSFNYGLNDIVVKAQKDTQEVQKMEIDVSEGQCKMNEIKSPRATILRQSTQRETINDNENVTTNSENAENVCMQKSSAEEAQKMEIDVSEGQCKMNEIKSSRAIILRESTQRETINDNENVTTNSENAENVCMQKSSAEEAQKMEIDVSEGQCKVNEIKSSRAIILRESTQRETINDNENVTTNSENAENVCVQKSSAEESPEESTLHNDTSMEKKIENKDLITMSEEDQNKLFTDLSTDKNKSPDNILKKRMSLCKSVEMINNEIEESSESKTSEKTKSINKSHDTPLCDSSSNSSKSDKSIDSDIEREYNLHGEEPSKFLDDDVPGDECRASETESSDPNDNGSDLADFVVNDDDISEEEEDQKIESDQELYNNENSEVQESELIEEHEKEQIQKEIEEEVMKKEQQNKILERKIETVINKSTDTTNRKTGISKKSININLPEMFERDNKNEKISKIEGDNKRRRNNSIKNNGDDRVNTKRIKYEKEYRNQAMGSNTTEVSRKGVKRISEDISGNLRVSKKRKQSQFEKQEFPSRSMSNLMIKKNKISVEHVNSVSFYGSTTNFSVENLRKVSKSRKT
ncbi:uncharacterized protein LOC116424374 isoform X2 [Nomia melanderi]|uniref:uncharacterized protein LOC116424374 isoform X2 n=1 Tax=Nomia melanderi TaxID=2448451 RepID=UPI003FCC68B0